MGKEDREHLTKGGGTLYREDRNFRFKTGEALWTFPWRRLDPGANINFRAAIVLRQTKPASGLP